MRILIVEDDLVSRSLLDKILSAYGDLKVVEDGEAAVYAFVKAWRQGQPYDLICMDIMMPKISGIDALKYIRQIEMSNSISDDRRAKVIMISSLDDTETMTEAFFKGDATSYLVKPLKKVKVAQELENLGKGLGKKSN